MPPEHYTPQEVAKAMKLAYRTVLEHIRRGHLRASGCGLDGGAPYRIHPSDYEAWRVWMAERPVGVALIEPEQSPARPRSQTRSATATAPATKTKRSAPPKVTRSPRTGRRVVELVSA